MTTLSRCMTRILIPLAMLGAQPLEHRQVTTAGRGLTRSCTPLFAVGPLEQGQVTVTGRIVAQLFGHPPADQLSLLGRQQRRQTVLVKTAHFDRQINF